MSGLVDCYSDVVLGQLLSRQLGHGLKTGDLLGAASYEEKVLWVRRVLGRRWRGGRRL